MKPLVVSTVPEVYGDAPGWGGVGSYTLGIAGGPQHPFAGKKQCCEEDIWGLLFWDMALSSVVSHHLAGPEEVCHHRAGQKPVESVTVARFSPGPSPSSGFSDKSSPNIWLTLSGLKKNTWPHTKKRVFHLGHYKVSFPGLHSRGNERWKSTQLAIVSNPRLRCPHNSTSVHQSGQRGPWRSREQMSAHICSS